MPDHPDDRPPVTPWSALAGHLDDFLDDESDPIVGAWAAGQGPNSPDRLIFRHLLGLLLDQRDRRLSMLEVGCGAGIEVDGLDAAGLLARIDYHGVDLTPELVAVSQRKHPALSFTVGDVFGLDRRADVVLCRHVLEHLEDGLVALGRLWDACTVATVVSWFRRPSWNIHEGSLSWEGVKLDDGNDVQFLHQRYLYRDAAALIRNDLRPAGFHRVDFDNQSHPCSIWILSRDPLPTELVASVESFALSATFVDAISSPPAGSTDAERVAELLDWNRQLEEARDWWRAQAEGRPAT